MRRIPLNLFTISFGLAGLAEAWLTASDAGRAPEAIGDVILGIAAFAWLVTVTLYLRYALTVKRALLNDLEDEVAGPFAALVVIVPMLIASYGIVPHAHEAGTVVVDVFLVLTVLLGGWLTGQWIYGPLTYDRLHPGYFLPTVAGGFVASASAAAAGQLGLAKLMFGLGVICWVILGSMILGRLLFRPPLPPALTPTIAIEIAPAAVGSIAWFTMNDGRIDAVLTGLAGYGLLMVIAQIRLLPLYARLRFMPAVWGFTFSWAAVVTAALLWVEAGVKGHTARDVETYVLLAAITLFVGAIGARTLVALARRDLLPAPPPSSRMDA